MQELILDGHKLAWHKERLEAWMRGERIAPITVDMALSRSCSYNCVYCYGRLQANEERRLTKDAIFRFLDDASHIGVKGVSFVGDGESTLSPYLREAVARGKQNGLDMALGTNGYLLDEDGLEEMLTGLTYLRFNISAAEPLSYSLIMGCPESCFHKVIEKIRKCARIKRENNLLVTLGLQMVLLPRFSDQILPFARLGRELGVDYAVIKHCSDDEIGSIGVDYSQYVPLEDVLREAEGYSTGDYQVRVKWSKILSRGLRAYSRCYGPAFILQISGSGLVAPCGMLFNEKYRKYHIGNIAERPFKEIYNSDRYWEVLGLLTSDRFDPQTMCGKLCLQDKVNEFLWDLKQGRNCPALVPEGPLPRHINFV